MGWRVRLASSATVLAAAARLAAAQPESAAFEYRPSEGCPGEFTFRAQVQARTPHLVLAPPAEGAKVAPLGLVVSLEHTARGYAGRLEIWRNGQAAESALEAPTCDEVVAGLSIAAALDANDRAEAKVAPPAAVVTVPPPPPAPPPARAVFANPIWAVLASGGLAFGYGPGAAPLAGLGLERRLGPWPWGVAASAVLGNDVADRSTSLAFDFYLAELHVCPLALGAGSSSQLVACAELEGGLSRTRASTAEVEHRPWLAPGASLRFFARFSRLVLEPRLGLRVPLVRDRYLFRPDHEAFRTPALAGEASLALGIAL